MAAPRGGYGYSFGYGYGGAAASPSTNTYRNQYDSYASDFSAGAGFFGFGDGGAAQHSGGGGFGFYRDSEHSPLKRKVNPEYYQKERGYGYEGTRSSAIDEFENPEAKRRKVENVSICVDFVRGHCAKGESCSKAHANFVESIDEREILAKLKFCHDFQNRGMCSRGGCMFLHVTRREEDEFLLTGTIPASVFERMKDWTANHVQPHTAEHDNSGGGGRGGGGRGRGRGRGGGRGRGRGRGGGDGSGGRGGGGGGGRDWGFTHSDTALPHFETRQKRPQSTSTFKGGGGSVNQFVIFGNYCLDFLKGTCSKGTACSLKHVEIVDDPEDRVGLIDNMFCHDFQNKTCHRPFCKYIHSTKEEGQVFIDQGYFPPSLNARNREKLFFSDLCIDFLRSQCIRGHRCNYKHTSKVEYFNERIALSRSIFCRDFQEQGCVRYNCKLLHAKKQDEQYFLRTGTLPTHLCLTAAAGNVDVSHLDGNVCREFVKNKCNRGGTCKFYHPTPSELQSLLSRSGGSQNRPVGGGEPAEDEFIVLLRENFNLRERVTMLEHLLAEACHCITLAVGDQNPAITELMKTISEITPTSAILDAQSQGISSSGSTIGGCGSNTT